MAEADVPRVGMGELAVTVGGRLAVTGVGSCVVLVLHDAKARVGGIAHPLLPSRGGREDNAWKYVDGALEHLVARLVSAGASRERLTARLVGGAAMFRGVLPVEGPVVGAQNLEAARRLLSGLGIRITGEDVGGSTGRSLVFDAATGELQVKGRRGVLRI